MGKKLLGVLLCLCTWMSVPAYALSIDLSLFTGGLSVLDALFLIGAGFTLIGILFLCLAVFQGDKEEPVLVAPISVAIPVEETEVEDEEEDAEEIPEEESEEEPEDVAEESVDEETTDEEPEEFVDEPEETEEDSSAEEPAPREYPTLTLTGTNNTEFKVLPLTESVTLGRRPGNDLVFADTTVSGVHCAITVEGDSVYLEDKGSTNGTYLNREKLTEKTEIKKGDILALGKLEFKISL
ncbi:MAG: FHA domain-containing protein [Clostridia bacterium]|nr:FHA domain-containing protein [Clostridia bacterium]